MYHIKNDPRQKKSAQLLSDATVLLLRKAGEAREEDGAALTISGICQEAGVSRSTFYRLFDTTDDVLAFLCDSVFDAILSECAEKKKAGAAFSPAEVYGKWLTAYQNCLAGLLRLGKLHVLMEAHRKALYQYADTLFPDMDKTSNEFVFFSEMRSGVLLGAVRAWLRTGQETPIAEIIQFCNTQLRFRF